MDHSTKYAYENGKIPTRYYNQLDDTRSITEKYNESHKAVLDQLTESDETTEIIITTTTGR